MCLLLQQPAQVYPTWDISQVYPTLTWVATLATSLFAAFISLLWAPFLAVFSAARYTW